MLKLALTNLEHKEYRVRLVVASVLEALASVYCRETNGIFSRVSRPTGLMCILEPKTKFTVQSTVIFIVMGSKYKILALFSIII